MSSLLNCDLISVEPPFDVIGSTDWADTYFLKDEDVKVLSEATRGYHVVGVYYYLATTTTCEGFGHLVFRYKSRFYHHDLSHYSCYGPLDRLSESMRRSFESIEELERACSKALRDELEPILRCWKEGKTILHII